MNCNSKCFAKVLLAAFVAVAILPNAVWAQGDALPPVVNMSFEPNGFNEWFKTSPAAGTLTAIDAFPSAITDISCTGANVSNLTGLGTSNVSATLSVFNEGITAVSCTATDSAGNSGAAAGSGNTATVKLDTVVPAIVTNPALDHCSIPGNNGWCRGDLVAGFTATDFNSGLWAFQDCVAGSTQCGYISSHNNFEGANIFIASVGVCDLAGNCNFGPVYAGPFAGVDYQSPVVFMTPDRDGDFNGWYNAPVIFTPIGTDNVAGIASCTEPITYSGPDSANYITLAGSCTDFAGNTASGAIGFIYDATPPVVSATPDRLPDRNDWYNHPFTVTTTGVDETSGVAACTAPIAIPTDIEGFGDVAGYNIDFNCLDFAGNQGISPFTFKYDATPPTIDSVFLNGIQSEYGWFRTRVIVIWLCADNLSGGVAGFAVLRNEGADQSATGTCTDIAGNSAPLDTQTGINIDRTPPEIIGSRTPEANANGWNSDYISVSFSCTDALSGVASSTPDTTLTEEGAGQAVTGTCDDLAGNLASATVDGINIDLTAPEISILSPLADGQYLLNEAVAADYSCRDALAGIESCVGRVPDGANFETSILGPRSFRVIAADLAGNLAIARNFYVVVSPVRYTFIGFRDPLSPGDFSGVFRLGRTIPIKWQLLDAQGNFVSALSAVRALLIDSVACDGSGDGQEPFEPGGSGETGLRYDTAANQYIFNWQTKGLSEGCYQILLMLDDNSTYSTRVQLKN